MRLRCQPNGGCGGSGCRTRPGRRSPSSQRLSLTGTRSSRAGHTPRPLPARPLPPTPSSPPGGQRPSSRASRTPPSATLHDQGLRQGAGEGPEAPPLPSPSAPQPWADRWTRREGAAGPGHLSPPSRPGAHAGPSRELQAAWGSGRGRRGQQRGDPGEGLRRTDKTGPASCPRPAHGRASGRIRGPRSSAASLSCETGSHPPLFPPTSAPSPGRGEP